MRRLRVLVMMDEFLVPPDDAGDMSLLQRAPFKTEYDVLTCLRAIGHDVRPLGVKSDLSVIRKAIHDFRPHICFNLVEDFDGIPARDQHVVSYLELMNQSYTGCNPRGLTLARDKALTKKILAYHGISVPQFAVFALNRSIRRPPSLEFPLLVKSLTEEGSTGISQANLVYDDDQLAQRIAMIHEKLHTDAIAEQYIDGRELYVSVIGNRRLQSFPIWELDLSALPADAPRIATEKVKWNLAYQNRYRITSHAAKLPTLLAEHITEMSKNVYRTLDLSGYARIDFRLTPNGQVYLLEANPNPQIAADEDFADSSRAAGLSYESLLHRILQLGLNYHPVGLAA